MDGAIVEIRKSSGNCVSIERTRICSDRDLFIMRGRRANGESFVEIMQIGAVYLTTERTAARVLSRRGDSAITIDWCPCCHYGFVVWHWQRSFADCVPNIEPSFLPPSSSVALFPSAFKFFSIPVSCKTGRFIQYFWIRRWNNFWCLPVERNRGAPSDGWCIKGEREFTYSKINF